MAELEIPLTTGTRMGASNLLYEEVGLWDWTTEGGASLGIRALELWLHHLRRSPVPPPAWVVYDYSSLDSPGWSSWVSFLVG